MQLTTRPGITKSEPIDGGYRLSNELFEAVISTAKDASGITALAARGGAKREAVAVKEQPIAITLATDAPRVDIVAWNGHAGSGNPLPPEEDWGIALKLHEQPPDYAGVQRLTDFPIGPPFITDTYYPGFYWYRTMLGLPKEWRGKPIVFTLGGCDRYDWRAYWIYLNGTRVGQSSNDPTYTGEWHDTPTYVIKPDDEHYKLLKFGDANQLSVQARGLDRRTPEMHHRDLERYSGQSLLCDQFVSAGEATQTLSGFDLVEHRTSTMDDGTAAVDLVFTHPSHTVSAIARYWLSPGDAAIHKQLTIQNETNQPITLLEADVLTMSFDQKSFREGGQGWPLRVGNDWFAGVTHPAGVARWSKDTARLQVIPGQVLDPQSKHECVTKAAVVGVGDGPRAFSDYLQAHGRRKVQFLNMYSLYGLAEIATGLFEKIELTEPLVMKNVDQMRDLQKRDIKFDYYCIDTGWNNPEGDLKDFHPTNFPNGPAKALGAIHELGMKPLLWISPACGPTVFRPGVGSPVVPQGGEDNTGIWGYYCLAGDKWRSTLREAMLHHIKNNGVRGFKLDEVTFYCGRSSHGHLPNKFGVEQQMDALIDTLNRCKAECPDLLVMFYWRVMSPWWLLHADTLYERGLLMEGSTPSPQPSRIIRQSVTTSLDQGHDYNWDRMPLIGQDSLGVWLSNTRWASWMGAEGWRDAWIMDFIRGNLTHQLWGDLGLLQPDDFDFMERIAKFTKPNANLLPNPKRVLGSPWREEPYGYACGDGSAAVIAIHNASFDANTVTLSPTADLSLATDKPGWFQVEWIYKGGTIHDLPKQRVRADQLLEIELGSFEVCLAKLTPSSAPTTQPAAAPPALPGTPRVTSRFIQKSWRPLRWDSPADMPKLARVMNGRTTPTLTLDSIVVGPDRSDERDRDIVEETTSDELSLEKRDKPTKLLVIARFDREGIAWHHLAPFTIVTATATSNGKPLEVKTTPHIVHEEAGGWSWILNAFDLPPGTGDVSVAVNSYHPKTVTVSMEVWHADE